ncbi:Mpo1 family 2-hydroxy fatty acid dioxygenase [Sphaerotilaceae bacterium SBD11-9]
MTQQRTTLDLLTQYATYHRDRRNIVTHFVGVPMIVFSIGVLLARLHLSLPALDLTAAWVAFCLAAAWYLSRRGPLTLGFAVTAGVGVLIALAHGVASGSTASWLSWGVGMFAIGWVIQFVGHYYEGRKPAFVDDITGLLVGPMFVTAEALFSLGWNRPLLAEIERRAGPTHIRDLAHPA